MSQRIIRDCGLLACGCALALLATACESSEKKVHSAPVAQAHAPTISASKALTAPSDPPKPTPVQVAQAKVPPAPNQPDPVDKLVEEAEKQYQEGQQEYAAGHPKPPSRSLIRQSTFCLRATSTFAPTSACSANSTRSPKA